MANDSCVFMLVLFGLVCFFSSQISNNCVATLIHEKKKKTTQRLIINVWFYQCRKRNVFFPTMLLIFYRKDLFFKRSPKNEGWFLFYFFLLKKSNASTDRGVCFNENGSVRVACFSVLYCLRIWSHFSQWEHHLLGMLKNILFVLKE